MWSLSKVRFIQDSSLFRDLIIQIWLFCIPKAMQFRPNVLYARLRRNCSSLKYDLFRSNIITDSRCVCGYIREDASHFLLNCRLYIEQRTILFNCLHHHNFRKDTGTLLFGDSQKDHTIVHSFYRTFMIHNNISCIRTEYWSRFPESNSQSCSSCTWVEDRGSSLNGEGVSCS